MEKSKITIEIPTYLKNWLHNQDVSNNAMITMLLRREYLSETQINESKIIHAIQDFFENKKLPF